VISRELVRRRGRREAPRETATKETAEAIEDGIATGEISEDEEFRFTLDGDIRDELLDNARMMARENPKKTAEVMRNWLRD